MKKIGITLCTIMTTLLVSSQTMYATIFTEEDAKSIWDGFTADFEVVAGLFAAFAALVAFASVLIDYILEKREESENRHKVMTTIFKIAAMAALLGFVVTIVTRAFF